jgi:ribosomal protein S18
MSQIIDDETNDELNQQGETVELDPVVASEPAQETEPEEEQLPDKYRGKSQAEIARMHQEAERALGRQGSEVGELRRIVDNFIQSQTSKQQAQESSEEVDFFADPEKAINRAIASHPKIREAEQVTASLKKQEALARVQSQHPDLQDIVGSSEFADWVGKSKVRQELFVRADKGFDYDAADELLSTFKERKQILNNAKSIEQVERKQAVKSASTGVAKGSSEPSKGKIYRRADIINLMMNNPDRYQSLQSEIMAAYASGRVK